MAQQISMSIGAFLAALAATALIAAAIAVVATLSIQRKRRTQIVAKHLDSMFKAEQLHAIRADTERHRIFARSNSDLIPITGSEQRDIALVPGCFSGVPEEDLLEAMRRLRRDKRYQMVDWNEGDAHYRELTLRPEHASH